MISGRQLVLPSMPRTNNDAIHNPPPSQWPTLVHADSVDCIKFVCVTIYGDYFSSKNDFYGLAFGEIM